MKLKYDLFARDLYGNEAIGDIEPDDLLIPADSLCELVSEEDENKLHGRSLVRFPDYPHQVPRWIKDDMIQLDPYFRVVVIDETEYWASNITAELGKIEAVYLFDVNRSVHCCELTPSRECHLLYHVTEHAEDESNVAEDFYEETHESDPVIYIHVDQMDRLSTIDCGVWEFESSDQAYEDLLEGALEYYRCNHIY